MSVIEEAPSTVAVDVVEEPKSVDAHMWDVDNGLLNNSLPEPSLHKISQESAIAGWNQIRQDLLKVVIETSCIPLAQLCFLYTTEATYRCLSCSPSDFFCQE